MLKEIKFALYAIKKNIQSSVELRGSFLASIIGMMINNLSFLFIWLFMVQTVGVIGGWTGSYIFGMEGFVALSFGICYSLFGGLSEISKLIVSGRFDQFMLSPKNTILRLATSSFKVSAVGDIIFGIICLGICAYMNSFSLWQMALTLILSIVACIVFASVILFSQTLSFYFYDGESVSGGVLELFLTPALMHGGAFQGTLRTIFTFVLPSLLIGALPIEAIINVDINKVLLITSLTILWLMFSIIFFYKSVRRYESANFITFGS